MTTTLTIRVDEGLKSEAEELFGDIGMSLSTAITCFFKKCVGTGEIPFRLSRPTPRERLLAAKREADTLADDKDAPRCTSPEELHDFLFS